MFYSGQAPRLYLVGKPSATQVDRSECYISTMPSSRLGAVGSNEALML